MLERRDFSYRYQRVSILDQSFDAIVRGTLVRLRQPQTDFRFAVERAITDELPLGVFGAVLEEAVYVAAGNGVVRGVQHMTMWF